MKMIKSIKSTTGTKSIKGIRSNMGFRGNGRGFTLVELLVYMGIFAILLTVMTQIFVSIIDTQLEAEATTSAAQDGQFLYSRLIYDIHQADAIAVPSDLGDTATALVLVKDGTEYEYSLDGTDLEISDGTTSAALNSYDTQVSDLEFRKIGNIGGKDTVQIQFTITSKTLVDGRPEIREFQTTAGLR